VTEYPVEAPVATAVLDALTAAIGSGRVGYGEKPTGGGANGSGAFAAYAIVYPGTTTPGEGTAAAPAADGQHVVQVTYVADRAQDADTVRDTGRGALLGVHLTVAGRHCEPVQLADSTLVARDVDPQPSTWFAVDRYLIATTPA